MMPIDTWRALCIECVLITKSVYQFPMDQHLSKSHPENLHRYPGLHHALAHQRSGYQHPVSHYGQFIPIGVSMDAL